MSTWHLIKPADGRISIGSSTGSINGKHAWLACLDSIRSMRCRLAMDRTRESYFLRNALPTDLRCTTESTGKTQLGIFRNSVGGKSHREQA